MGKLSRDEYFKLYDEKLKAEYFKGTCPLPDDPSIRDDFLKLKDAWKRLNKEESRFNRGFIIAEIDKRHSDNPELFNYIEPNPDNSEEAEDCLLYCLNEGLYNAVRKAADYKKGKLDLALMFYASEYPTSFGFRCDEIPSSQISASLIRGGANPHAIIETQMPTVDNKAKEEKAQNTPFMYFLEKTAQSGKQPVIPSPERFSEFYDGCPFTLKDPQGETLFSLFIKRRLYKKAEELLSLMSKTLSPKEMNEAINIRRVDVHFKEVEKRYIDVIEKLTFEKGDVAGVQKAQDNRKKMQQVQEKIHQFVEKNKQAAKNNAEEKKKAEKSANTPTQPEKNINPKVVELVQATFDF